MSEYSPEYLEEVARDWAAQVEWFEMGERAAAEELMTEAQLMRLWEREQE